MSSTKTIVTPAEPLGMAVARRLAHDDSIASTSREDVSYLAVIGRAQGVSGELTPLDLAVDYSRRGWNPVPVLHRSKKPLGSNWQDRIIREADVHKYFNGKAMNVGVTLGPTSNGLTDLDLDCSEAIALAPFILPDTEAIFGRKSKPASHRLYRTSLAHTLGKSTLKLTNPIEKTVLLELRAGPGAQTVLPGSTHESGEMVEWSKNGAPAVTEDADLLNRTKLLGSACLFARYFPVKGGRYHAAVTLGGFLSRCGYPAEYIGVLVAAVARVGGSDDPNARGKDAESAARAYEDGKNSFGYTGLKDVFGAEVAGKVAEWLDYKSPPLDHRPTSGGQAPAKLSNSIVTESSAATRFVELHANDLKYCHTTAAWFRWVGSRWIKDDTGFAYQSARKLAESLSEGMEARQRYTIEKTSFAASILRFAKCDPALAVNIEHWDRDPWLLGTPEGTVDLRTGVLRKSVPDEGVTKITAVAPSDVGCPLWQQFLRVCPERSCWIA